MAGAVVGDRDGLRPVGRARHRAGPRQREVHVVLVATGDVAAGVGPPPVAHAIDAEDLLVPDDIHDAEAARHRRLVAGGVGSEQPREHRLDLGDLGRVADGDRPVERPALLVLTRGADGARAHDAVTAGVGIRVLQQAGKGRDTRLGDRVAAGLGDVDGHVLYPGRQVGGDRGQRHRDGRGRNGTRRNGTRRNGARRNGTGRGRRGGWRGAGRRHHGSRCSRRLRRGRVRDDGTGGSAVRGHAHQRHRRQTRHDAATGHRREAGAGTDRQAVPTSPHPTIFDPRAANLDRRGLRGASQASGTRPATGVWDPVMHVRTSPRSHRRRA